MRGTSVSRVALLASFPVVAALLVGQRAAGGDPTNEAEVILVTARGSPRAASETPGGSGVITASDVRERPAVSVSDLAALVPGAARSADGPWGGDVSIRGLSRDSVVLLVDGARVNTATDLAGRFGLVHPLEVERIEVLKGPISALYGSGSLGGVVNVITRRGRFADPAEWHGGLSLDLNSNPEGFDVYGYVSRHAPSDYVYASQSYREHGSYEDGSGDTVENTAFEDAETKLAFGRRMTHCWTVEANVQHMVGWDIGVPGTGTAPLPTTADVTYSWIGRTLVSLDQTLATDGGTLEESALSLYWQDVERRVVIDAFPESSALSRVAPEAQHDTVGSKWVNVLRWSAHEVTAGADVWQRAYDGSRMRSYQDGSVTEDQPLPDSTFASGGAFVEDDVEAGERVTLNAGGRLDAIRVENEASAQWEEGTENDQSWNVHGGGTWRASDSLNLKGIVASGYRAASLEERFQYLVLGGGVTKLGNPELDPERSLFYEAGADWTGDRASAGVSAYVNHLDDLISEEQVDEATIVNANVSEARIYGVEAQARADLARNLKAYANLAYTVGEDTEADDELPGVPPFSGLAGLACRPERGPWGYVETRFADRQSQTPEGVLETPGWATVDARLGWTWSRAAARHVAYVGVQNLFDADYRNYLSTYRGTVYDEPGRSWQTGYTITF